MTGASAEQLVLEVGKSSELVAVFQTIADAETDGEPKFSPQVCRDLAKAIACRTYAKAVLELCHLVRVADAVAGGGGYEMFFWGGGAARPSAFRGQVINGIRARGGRIAGMTASESGVEVAYPDGSFTVTFGRMPFLSALLEFLITTVGYPDADGFLRGALASSATQKAVSQQANGLSRLIYDYLRDHLPTAQNQRKFRHLIDFMENRLGDEFSAASVDDDVVFDFWRTESVSGAADGIDFKTFLAVFKAFVRLRQTLEQAADYQALENPKVIGFDREAGEVDPDAILGMVEAVDEYRSPLLVLEEPPASAIKFLNRREATVISLLFECGDAAFALPLSLMRCEVFGKGQGQITQALRRKVGAGELAEMVKNCAPLTYVEQTRLLGEVAAHVQKTLLASLHALARNRNREAINLIMALRPKLDFKRLKDLLTVEAVDDKVILLRAASVSDRFLSMIEDAARVGPDIAALMGEARKAFRGLSRQGFEEAKLGEAEIERGFAVGARTLVEVGAQVAAFVDLLNRLALPYADWDRQFAADKTEFSRQFEILYGGIQ